MIDEKYRDAIHLLADSVPIIGKTGARIESLRDRYARIVMPLEPNVNHIGIMYGGSLFILASSPAASSGMSPLTTRDSTPSSRKSSSSTAGLRPPT